MSDSLTRATLLYQQSRYDLAEQELMKELRGNPDNAHAHALLGLCLSEQKKHKRALEAARSAVGQAPDEAFPHFVLAKVYHEQDQMKLGEKSLAEAIRLDPTHVDHFRLLACFLMDREKWQEMLRAAELGLALDAEDGGCANLRVMALNQLGRSEEVEVSLEATLEQDPDNSLTHANLGWRRLESGKVAEAKESFRESLRLDPEMDWARQGMLTALKAKNFIYRLMLGYFFWMAKLTPRARWGVIIGGYVLFRIMRTTVRKNPDLGPYLWPPIIAYAIFALLTWISDPLFNLMLRLDRFGRHILSRDQIKATNLFGLCVIMSLLTIAAAIIFKKAELVAPALCLGILVIPISGTFSRTKVKNKIILGIYTAAISLCVLASIPVFFVDTHVAMTLCGIALFGTLLFSWVANTMR